jgi:hypothetical protein
MSTKSVLNPNSGKTKTEILDPQNEKLQSCTPKKQNCLTSSNRYNTRYSKSLSVSPPEPEFVPKIDPDIKDPHPPTLISKEPLPFPAVLVAVKQEETNDSPTDHPVSQIDTKEGILGCTKAPLIVKEESQEIKIETNVADEEMDTKAVTQAIQAELKRMQIPQYYFAKQVLNRTQGTLSDLLSKPQPWSELRSGRHTYRRMAEWLRMPDSKRSLVAYYGECYFSCNTKPETCIKQNFWFR